jgi:two-component system chemotaxis sensor kinase CheA
MDLSAYLDLFVAEAREHLGAAYGLVSRAEEGPAADAALREVFRHVHSVKGMAASMGFGAMSGLAHDAESLMEGFRAGRMKPRAATRRLLCETLACLERMVERAERREDVDDGERTSLQSTLREWTGHAGRGSFDASQDTGGTTDPDAGAEARRHGQPAGCVNVAVIVRRDRPFPAIRAAIVLGRLGKLGTVVRTDPPMAALRTGRFDGRLLVTLLSEIPLRGLAARIAGIDDIETFTLVPAEAPESRTAASGPVASLRVRADRIDGLIDDVLELMSSLGRLESGLASAPGTQAARDAESVRRLARRAYDTLVELRLVPFETASQRLRSTADELSRKLGKTVALEVTGQDVRIDRGLLEHVMDPLLHMVRNAIDHGIEAPELRRTLRKQPAGRVAVRLARQPSRLTVAVEDDGRGLDPRRLKQTAIERGLITPSEAMRMSDAAAFQLVTEPGFSTVDEPNEISGRGVGMDVVRSAVESVGGRLRIDAVPGRGTRFELNLPSSVSLVQTFLVRAGGITFAVPLAAIGRMAPMDDHSTAWHDGKRYWSAGASEVPVASLRELLALPGASTARGGMALLGTCVDGRSVGLEVDEVLGRKELVVRPLPPPLSGLPGYSGAGVLEDGSIVLVLEPMQIPGL